MSPSPDCAINNYSQARCSESGGCVMNLRQGDQVKSPVCNALATAASRYRKLASSKELLELDRSLTEIQVC